jgi:hypothetical protein
MAGEIEIKLKGLRDVRQELKVLQFELSQATDPEQMAELSQRAGELRDNLKRANEQASVFAAGSPFEQTNNALGLMSSQIMSLDFEGAAESAKLFATAAKGINGQLIATQLKSLGSVVMTLSKAFIKLGISLLTNPIFLIAAAITALVLAFTVFEGKLGKFGIVLKVAFGPLYLAIEAIKLLIQGVKDLLDWMGLTAFAAEEAAEKQVAAQEKVAKSYEDKRDKLVDAYDQEIRLAKIAGEDTTKIEREKQQAIIKTSEGQLAALNTQIIAMRAAGNLTKEKADEMRKSMAELRKGIHEAKQEIQAINAQEVADTKKKNEEVEKADKDSYKKRIEAAKQYGAERLAVQRLIRDLELELMQEGITKDLDLNKEKYARLIADTQNNEKLLDSEKTRLKRQYEELQFEAEKAIRQKYDDETQAQIDLSTANRVAAQQKEQEEFLKRNEDARKAEKEAKDKADAEELAAAKAKTDALLSIEQSLYSSSAALGELFINDSKKLERFQKAQALVQIGIDTAKAISALVAASQANPANAVTGGLAGIAQFASGIAQILTNVAKAKQLLTSPNASASGGGGGGSSTSAAVPSVAPQVNLFGQGNNMNNLSAAQPNDQSITVTAVVSETEITATQNKIKGIKQMSEL